MVPFAGWEMPVQYASVIAEAKAVREAAGMFDVGHMARLDLAGDRVEEFLEHVTANDVSKLEDGVGQYSLLPNASGGTVDDIIVYRISATVFKMVVNASNHEKDVEWLAEHNRLDIQIRDRTYETAMIAVQGPAAVGILAKLSATPDRIENAPMFGTVAGAIAGVECFSARSGYTGEDGYELVCAAADAPQLWGALAAAGVKPCGLGARDVLRVEAGLPLYGHELNDDLSPIAAGLGWVISKTKKFIGSKKIGGAREHGTPNKLQGIRLESKRLIAPGMKVFAERDCIGEVSSGVYSPMLDTGIALAFLDPAVALGTPCAIDVRGKHEPGTVVSKRFFKRSK